MQFEFAVALPLILPEQRLDAPGVAAQNRQVFGSPAGKKQVEIRLTGELLDNLPATLAQGKQLLLGQIQPWFVQ
ncbi:hypothetical protein D3C84_449360 [compost metagenome]